MKSPEILAAEQRIADLEKMLAAAQSRKALAQATDEPALKEVLDRGEAVQARITSRARFWSGNENQTFRGRLRSHTLWMDEIRAQEALESSAQDQDKAEREELKGLAAEVAGMIAKGEKDAAARHVRDSLVLMDENRSDLLTLQRAFDLSQLARKTYTLQKTQPTGRPRGRPRKLDEVEGEEATA